MARITLEMGSAVQKIATGTLIQNTNSGYIYIVVDVCETTDLIRLDGSNRYFGDQDCMENLVDKINQDSCLVILPKGTIVKLEQE